jgi:predicted transcriptional regulator
MVYELKEGKGASMKSSKENISEAELRTQLLKKISNSKDPKTQKENMLKYYKVEDIKDMTQEQIKDALSHFKD